MQWDQTPTEHFIFISFRFLPEVKEAVEKLRAALLAKRPPILSIVIDVDNAESIKKKVAKQLNRCEMALVAASRTYGEETRTQGCTFDEWNFIHKRQKPRFLIKMTETFDFEDVEFIFEDKISYLWLPNKATGKWGEPPTDLIDAIEKKWRNVLHRRIDPLFTRQIDWEQVKVDDAFIAAHGHSQLGQGGFGKVFKALLRTKTMCGDPDGRVEVPVAVKITWQASQQPILGAAARGHSRQQSMEEAMAEAFGKAVQEGEMSAAAEHAMVDRDLVVHVYGEAKGRLGDELARAFAIGADDECVGIILRYEGGGSLAERIDAAKLHVSDPGYRPLPMGERIRILSEITRALQEIHDNAGVAHGDIKPANVFLSAHDPPMVRLGDFGSAEGLRKGADMGLGSVSVTGAPMKEIRGTYIYAAPELLIVLLGVVATVYSSRGSDVYSLAVMMWEVLTLQQPFEEFTERVLLAQAVADVRNPRYPLRPSLDALPGDTPAALVRLIGECWSPDRKHRPSAEGCSQRLKRILNDMQSVAEVGDSVQYLRSELAKAQQEKVAAEVQRDDAQRRLAQLELMLQQYTKVTTPPTQLQPQSRFSSPSSSPRYDGDATTLVRDVQGVGQDRRGLNSEKKGPNGDPFAQQHQQQQPQRRSQGGGGGGGGLTPEDRLRHLVADMQVGPSAGTLRASLLSSIRSDIDDSWEAPPLQGRGPGGTAPAPSGSPQCPRGHILAQCVYTGFHQAYTCDRCKSGRVQQDRWWCHECNVGICLGCVPKSSNGRCAGTGSGGGNPTQSDLATISPQPGRGGQGVGDEEGIRRGSGVPQLEGHGDPLVAFATLQRGQGSPIRERYVQNTQPSTSPSRSRSRSYAAFGVEPLTILRGSQVQDQGKGRGQEGKRTPADRLRMDLVDKGMSVGSSSSVRSSKEANARDWSPQGRPTTPTRGWKF